MVYQRLPETVHTIYAELLDQAIRAEAEAAVTPTPSGSFVSKIVKGRRYWYLQQHEGGRNRQRYLGAESPSLTAWMAEVEESKARRAPDEARRSELVRMLIAGGATGETAAIVKVLGAVAGAGLFRFGGVLVGTQAFACYANMLGVRFESAALRTADLDVAHEPALAVALAPDQVPVEMLPVLQRVEPSFFAVPELDPRRPSSSFKVRGRDLRVDFLTPARGHRAVDPVRLPLFGVAATPLPMLGYLIEGSVQAVVLGGTGILVNVPAPGRYALHKLWLASQRPVAEQAKARKDKRQAAALLEVLLEDRRDELRAGWVALAGRRREAAAVRRALSEKGGPESFANALAWLLDD